ncbi:MAG: hypothetical protein AVDCRST_MAG18-1140, partial [uncultured Thermomicrobiales bacterium]
ASTGCSTSSGIASSTTPRTRVPHTTCSWVSSAASSWWRAAGCA